VQIHVRRDGQNYGPYDEETTRSYLSAGSLSPEDLAWHEGLTDWQPLSQVLGLGPPPPPPPALPVSPPAAGAAPVAAPSSAQTAVAIPEPVAPPEPFDASALKPGRVDLAAAVGFPFREPELVRRAWWVPLASFVPILGIIAQRGWRLDIVRRVGRGQAPALPEPGDLGRFLSDGLLLWFTTIVVWAPFWVLSAIFGFEWLTGTLTVLWWALQTFFSESDVSFWALVGQVVTQLGVKLVGPALYLAIIYPIYRMGAIRFALTGRLSSFLQFGRNLRLLAKLLPEVMVIFFFDILILRVLAWAVDLFLLLVGVGLFLVPVVYFPTYYWITGHLFGQVAAKVLALEAEMGAAADPA